MIISLIWNLIDQSSRNVVVDVDQWREEVID